MDNLLAFLLIADPNCLKDGAFSGVFNNATILVCLNDSAMT